ncbi:hypothetical protein NG831_06330 [Xanthomonas sacchari]|uniref:hypothetical protein n=1 Tax=Xanthomonas sacchari TaxID=56458 RepID=UPI002251D038|nr:hypothetical protein [Xanthomonas sacchari]MCW0413519.1 hypothetical protein [Xanthomonas sacchari]UYK67776.1 hypothetical protein NG831_06330 [Xanthomonas sacchari]
MTDKKFITGLLLKPKHERAPDYVICKLSIKREELIAWLQEQDGEWINADVKESQNGKLYAQVDEWKPDRQRTQPERRPQQRAPQRQQAQPPADEFYDDENLPF